MPNGTIAIQEKIQALLAEADRLLSEASVLANEISMEINFRGLSYFPALATWTLLPNPPMNADEGWTESDEWESSQWCG